jgi:hypothetical protein
MKRSVYITLFFSLLGATLCCLLASSGSAEEKPSGKAISLFNGKDLSNFYTWLADSGKEDPDRVFSVVEVDGAPAIRISGQHLGGLITKEEFSSYRLVAEFRWGMVTWGGRKQNARDSGILVHCQGPDGSSAADFKGPWMVSVESQVIEGGVGDIILVPGYDKDKKRAVPKITTTTSKDRDGEIVYDPKGEAKEFESARINWFGRDPDWKDVLGFRGKDDVESPAGQWTRVEVLCDGDKITISVNGKVVNAGARLSLTRGKILFQSEGAELYFRKIELTPLGK